MIDCACVLMYIKKWKTVNPISLVNLIIEMFSEHVESILTRRPHDESIVNTPKLSVYNENVTLPLPMFPRKYQR